MGVARDNRVAVVLSNGPAMAIAFLATAIAGISAPLNPAYCESEFDFYLSDLNAQALIVQEGVDSPATRVASRRGIPMLTLSADRGLPDEFTIIRSDATLSSGNGPIPSPDDVALVLYTSGTTSRPKRVPLTHAKLSLSAHNVETSLVLKPTDRCLNIMPLFHVHGLVGVVLSTLVAGASVVLPPAFDSLSFFDWMKEFQPTWYSAVPAIHQAILANAKNHVATIQRSKLRLIRSASAPLPTRLMAELEGLFKVPVIEAYGMTEAAHQVASNPLPPIKRKPGSVGVATGVEIAIMSEDGTPLKQGEKGEVVLRGPSVVRFYDDNTEANEQAFRHGWFRTGDQGYLDSDGFLFITGRLKEVVNKGGEKIALQEVDAALLAHPGVYQAVAFAIPHPSLGEDIAAAVVVDEKTTEATINQYLQGQLAEFKIPSRLVIVDEIPKSATGKIQRSGLADRFAARLAPKVVAPKSDLETRISDIYAEVLSLKEINAAENFFALGGDSLRAMQVIARVREVFNVNLSIATIFGKSTVRDLAQEISRAMESASAA
jgi:acyl-CoA synthetase (AMP-forming)/AMP-acid ligase II